eukprot:TRINITY_DN81269_c0_g1_i1.p1 TRINITY_DN81269_c0_g1~~TRINITY_DN81269_c0_g1_i1.p1  ORF type:complete len:265 (+),score=78.30 TRINITY_DN81269_c0_g1_i1:80-874(+)
MAGVVRKGRDANPYGSKFKEEEGGIDAGQGKRTYTTPSYTLFVNGIPDAEGSAAVQEVFENDPGFLQCRPVGHKRNRRMCFIDYGSIEDATRGLRAHQGHKWDPIDKGLKIDFDHDARQKRNVALDSGHYEPFFATRERVAPEEDEGEIFKRLRQEAKEDAREEKKFRAAPPPSKKARKASSGKSLVKKGFAAKLKIKKAGAEAAETEEDQKTAATDATGGASKSAPLGGLLGYGSESESSEEEASTSECEDDDEEEESEEEDG